MPNTKGGAVIQIQTETLRLVNGQRQEGMPPGITVLTTPLHHVRDRGGETFVLLLDLEEPTPARLYRELGAAAAQAFWSTSAGVTAALRRAVIAASQVLFDFNRQAESTRRYFGALSCAALTSDEFFLAQAGPAYAYAFGGSGTERLVGENLPLVGTSPVAQVRVTYLPVHNGDRLVLASRGLARVISEDALQRALALAERKAALDALEQVSAGGNFFALLVRWSVAEPPPSPEPARRRLSLPHLALPSLPTPTRRPQTPPTALREPLIAPRRQPERPAAQRWEPVEVWQPPQEETAEPPFEEEAVKAEEAIEEWEAESPEPFESLPQPQPVPRTRTMSGADGITWRRQDEPLMSPASAPPPSLVERLRLGERLSSAGERLSDAAAGIGRGARTLLRRTLPGRERRPRGYVPPEPRPPLPENPRLMATITVVILLAVITVTALAWFNYGGGMRRQQILDEANQQAAQARLAADPVEQRVQWQAVLTTLVGWESDAEAAALLDEAHGALDRLDGVLRVTPLPLRTFGSDVAIRRLVVRGMTLFLLDVSRQEVEQISLVEGNPTAAAGRRILRAGDSPDGQQVVGLVDMGWNAPGGAWTTDRLVVLDAASRLWVYDPAWPDALTSLPLGSAQGEGAPQAMRAFEGRLYLLDPAANQIWRYWPRDGGYPDRAEPYFATAAPQSLASAVDLAINGSVYVLLADGTILKFHDGESTPFTVSGVPEPAPRFIGLALDRDVAGAPLFLADAADERIVVLDAQGAFRAQLRAEAGQFASPQALALDGTGRKLYLVAGATLYALDLAGPAFLWEGTP